MAEIGMGSIMFLGATLVLSNIILLNTGIYI